MWYKAEFSREGGILALTEVDPSVAEKGRIEYIEAKDRSEASKKAKAQWERWQKEFAKSIRDRERALYEHRIVRDKEETLLRAQRIGATKGQTKAMLEGVALSHKDRRKLEKHEQQIVDKADEAYIAALEAQEKREKRARAAVTRTIQSDGRLAAYAEILTKIKKGATLADLREWLETKVAA